MSNKMHLSSLPLLLLLLILHSTTAALAQTAPALSPGPAPPTDVNKILTKAGQFTVLLRLLRSTKVGDQINNQLGSTNSELTLFAPPDNAFSSLKTGTLNQLSDQQKVQLLQFHIVPSFISISNFQTLSNPVQTQAADTYEYPLNITTDGSQVNITTGVVNATISGTVYSDNQLAIYQVDKVLQPLGIFAPRPMPPAPAPAPPNTKKKAESENGSPVGSVDASGSFGGGVGSLWMVMSFGVSVFAAIFL